MLDGIFAGPKPSLNDVPLATNGITRESSFPNFSVSTPALCRLGIPADQHIEADTGITKCYKCFNI